MVKVIQTIGLENGNSINDYDYFKTVGGVIGAYDRCSEKWVTFENNVYEFELVICPLKDPDLRELNEWVKENYSGDEIESFYDGRIEVMLTEKEAF